MKFSKEPVTKESSKNKPFGRRDVKAPFFQPKLTVGQSDSIHEKEADAVADKIVRPENNSIVQPKISILPIQRKCSHCEEDRVQRKENDSASTEQEAPAIVSDALNTGGDPMDQGTRSFMENRFGYDFGNVKIHTDTLAAKSADAIDALAYTSGSDIVFKKDQYSPDSDDGKKLLAHELTHVVQQGGADTHQVQKQDAGVTPCPSATDLAQLETNYRSMITDANSRGYTVAADNLEYWLRGTGGTKVLSVSWLRSFSSLLAAERVNEGRFETQLNDAANLMHAGSSRTLSDHWDRQFAASPFEELYYASGTSTITSTGTFSLAMTGSTVSMHGDVQHHWHDPYDWHAGLSAYIPGHGSISDSDALVLERCRGARSYMMEADWTRHFTGSIDVGTIWNSHLGYTWTGP